MKKFKLRFVLVNIVLLSSAISLGMEWPSDPTKQEQSEFSDYPLIAEQLKQFKVPQTSLTDIELGFLYAIEDNNESVINQYLDNLEFLQTTNVVVFKIAEKVAQKKQKPSLTQVLKNIRLVRQREEAVIKGD